VSHGKAGQLPCDVVAVQSGSGGKIKKKVTINPCGSMSGGEVATAR